MTARKGHTVVNLNFTSSASMSAMKYEPIFIRGRETQLKIWFP